MRSNVLHGLCADVLRVRACLVRGRRLQPGPDAARTAREGTRRGPGPGRRANGGDASRGAILFFHRPACHRCHDAEDGTRLGPDLARPARRHRRLPRRVGPAAVEGHQEGLRNRHHHHHGGQTVTGLLAEEKDRRRVVAARPGQDGKPSRSRSRTSTERPAASRRSCRTGWSTCCPAGRSFSTWPATSWRSPRRAGRARELRPAASLFARRRCRTTSGPRPRRPDPLPRRARPSSAARRSTPRVCANCHGTKEQPGSMPTSLRFAEGKFKNGADPFRMYQTLTHGFGMMTPQTWMVPRAEVRRDPLHPRGLPEAAQPEPVRRGR